MHHLSSFRATDFKFQSRITDYLFRNQNVYIMLRAHLQLKEITIGGVEQYSVIQTLSQVNLDHRVARSVPFVNRNYLIFSQNAGYETQSRKAGTLVGSVILVRLASVWASATGIKVRKKQGQSPDICNQGSLKISTTQRNLKLLKMGEFFLVFYIVLQTYTIMYNKHSLDFSICYCF